MLREQEEPPRELTEVLSALWRDSLLSLVVRDYALQHLAAWHVRAGKSQQDRILLELRDAAAQADHSFAGTALIGLHRIQRENPGATIPFLNDQIARLARDETANLLARIAAIQLAGEGRSTAMGEPLKRIASDAGQSPTLRIAALGSLGRLGGDGVAGVLTPIAHGTDSRLASVARSALFTLSQLKPSASPGQ